MPAHLHDTSGDARRTAASRASLSLVLTAIGLSAFLLFALELYAGRVVLPAFGGAPAVWTTALCFFTGTVFVGYLYAHVLATRLSRRSGAIVHGSVVVAALAATVLAPRDLAALRFQDMPPALNVLVVLAAIAGPAAFVFSTTTPLLSARFARDGNDPWWLYAVSNAASLAGLVAYPFIIEPRIPLSGQRAALQVLLAVLAVILLTSMAPRRRVPGPVPRETAAPDRPSRSRQARWLLAAAVPAGLLSATTMHLTTDHISSPVLWVGPLGVYLASFVVAFSERGRRVVPAAERLVPAAATLMWIPYLARAAWPVAVLVPLVLACYAVLAVAVHGRLALDRPATEYLTRFYVLLSAGGVAATAFVALVAPLVFSDVYEYPILIVASLASLALLPRPDAPADGRARDTTRALALRLGPYVAIGVALLVTVATGSSSSALFVAVLAAVGALAIVAGATPRRFAVATAVALVALSIAFAPHDVARVRTFFGITALREAEEGAARSEIHGTTLHGLQYLDRRAGEPTAYFVRSGPIGDVMAELDARAPEGASIGVVGLGIGTLAAYARPDDVLAFFEIDPAVVAFARDDHYFTYLADAPAPPRIVVGDGRLSLADEPAASFDVLVLDAFSSDAVPAHLLTAEAMRSYARLLRPGGIVVFQLTNRHFDLVGAVASTASSVGLDARTRSYTPDADEADQLGAKPSTWVVVGRAEDVARFDTLGWSRAGTGPILTDDYSDIMRLLR